MKSKLQNTLETLDRGEKRRFRQFLWSPYFNKNERVRALYDILTGNKFLTTEQVFHMIFPNQTFQEQKWYDVHSLLYQQLEKFLALEKASDRKTKMEVNLLETFISKRLDHNFTITEKIVEKTFDKVDIKNEDFYHDRYLLYGAKDDYFMQQEQRSDDQNLQLKMNSLDTFYIYSKLKNACEMLNRERIISVSYAYYLIKEIEEHVAKNNALYVHVPQINIYFSILRMLQKNSVSEFNALFEQLQRHHAIIETNELKGMFGFAQNFCIRRINRGEDAFLTQLLEVFKLQIYGGIYDRYESITQWNYRTIISIGLRLGEYKWTEEMIHHLKDKLEPKYKENTFEFNLALLYFETGDFKKALRQLSSIEFTDTYHVISARTLIIKIYFEQKDQDGVLDSCKALEQFLKRNKYIHKTQKEVNLNFLNYLKKTFKALNHPIVSKDEKNNVIHKLKTEIEQKDNVANKKWLLEKLNIA